MPDNNVLLDFGEPEKENSIIKVIGVGGGGGNAVNHRGNPRRDLCTLQHR